MKVSYTHEVPMGHRLKDHPGKCRNLHGHNYLVTVVVEGSIGGVMGMVIDFHDLKGAVKKVLDPFDHAFVLQLADDALRNITIPTNIIYTPFPPTAEELASYWQAEIIGLLNQWGFADLGVEVGVRETQNCEAHTW